VRHAAARPLRVVCMGTCCQGRERDGGPVWRCTKQRPPPVRRDRAQRRIRRRGSGPSSTGARLSPPLAGPCRPRPGGAASSSIKRHQAVAQQLGPSGAIAARAGQRRRRELDASHHFWIRGRCSRSRAGSGGLRMDGRQGPAKGRGGGAGQRWTPPYGGEASIREEAANMLGGSSPRRGGGTPHAARDPDPRGPGA